MEDPGDLCAWPGCGHRRDEHRTVSGWCSMQENGKARSADLTRDGNFVDNCTKFMEPGAEPDNSNDPCANPECGHKRSEHRAVDGSGAICFSHDTAGGQVDSCYAFIEPEPGMIRHTSPGKPAITNPLWCATCQHPPQDHAVMGVDEGHENDPVEFQCVVGLLDGAPACKCTRFVVVTDG